MEASGDRQSLMNSYRRRRWSGVELIAASPRFPLPVPEFLSLVERLSVALAELAGGIAGVLEEAPRAE